MDIESKFKAHPCPVPMNGVEAKPEPAGKHEQQNLKKLWILLQRKRKPQKMKGRK